ncbi:MAG: DUF3048 domain-containing protein [Eubacterium sp.]|jgi:hypothetical protein|nr:DUF3048 domain-containing protein [Eubacterium sp.]NBI85702.1 DUF3048 domain-containing protein [Lachnospiraceae bacterium]
MKHMKRAIAFAAACCVVFSGCGRKEPEPVKEPEPTEFVGEIEPDTEFELEIPTETEPVITGSVNPLTGEPMDEALAAQRPVSCMIGNTTDAMPQYGTSAADVLIEAPAEGGLTRLMTLYQDYANLPSIMSVRSCRHYYAYLSNEFEAIYVHYGQAIYATEMLKHLDDLNGLDGDLENVTFMRDKSRKSPHNAFVNGESIVAGIQKRGYRTEHAPTYKNRFSFTAEDRQLAGGVPAAVVEPGYLVNKPWFVYNEQTGLYERYQYKAAHVDGNNGEQLAFKNVIFQVCDYKMEPDGKYLDVKTASYSGTGKYISNGQAMDITWVKEVEDGIGTYYDASGNELELNPGKTCICIILNDAEDKIGVYGSEEEFQAARN